jgi:hypothetical protein
LMMDLDRSYAVDVLENLPATTEAETGSCAQ